VREDEEHTLACGEVREAIATPVGGRKRHARGVEPHDRTLPVATHARYGRGITNDAREEAERLVDYWTPLLVRILGETGVYAAFGEDERDLDAVARACALHPPTLRRVVRALTSRGVFERVAEGRYRLTALGREVAAHGFVNFKSQEVHAWAELEHSLRTGEAAFPAFFGAPMFDWLAARPARFAHFSDTMRRRTSALLAAALECVDWPEEGTVVDVGGGNGLLLERLLARRPALHAVLFDLPEPATEASALLERAGLTDRVEVVGGSFFDDVPPGHDLYVFANVLHDWDDEEARTILERCRAAMPAPARLRIFDAVLREDGTPDPGELLDLHMLVLLGARERTRAEWETLLDAAGFAAERFTPTPGPAWIDAVPV
jgi:hypothetical protein